MVKKDTKILKDISLESQIHDEKFVTLTEDFREYTERLKAKFDNFDKENPDEKKQINFLEKEKNAAFKKFDLHFNKVWETVSGFDSDKHSLYKKYYINKLCYLYGGPIELNRHVYTKPLGYAGDYIAMNYTYDYNYDNGKYLGESSFQKLINNYTSSTPIWRSNTIRKDFLKNKILEIINSKDQPKIASIGSGPVRELLELLSENKIKKHTNFLCLDFEKRAINYVKNEIKKIDEKNKNNLYIEYTHKNIIKLIKDKEINKKFDLIYVSGVFDYLSDRICLRMAKKLFDLLAINGILIICNASLENATYRGYYEFLGDWVMIYRTKEEMLAWTKSIENIADIKFEEPNSFSKYWFLSIKKLGQETL